MSMKSPRLAPEVVASIQDQAVRVRGAADEMTKRIAEFQTYLGSLAGRVDTTHFGTYYDHNDPNDEVELAVRLHRQEKTWLLSWGNYYPALDGRPINWQPLMEAPLRIKIAAIKMFPDLLEAIEKSQIQLAKDIEEATAEFDAFAKTLKKNGKEGA